MALFPRTSFTKWRLIVVLIVLLLVIGVVLGRLFYLDTEDHHFLIAQSKHESIHYRTLPANRGMIFDRNGVPLAISTPLDNIIFDPKVLHNNPQAWQALADDPVLNVPLAEIQYIAKKYPKSRYYIARKGVPPQRAKTLMDKHLPGVYLETQYRSYYPVGEATAQLVGFTNVNNEGQTALELVYNNRLRSTSGRIEVLESGVGQILRYDAYFRHPHPGQNITLSIDSRLQYVAYHALKDEVTKTQAKSGSVVVLDPKTGEVLAAVSYPDFNPNALVDRRGAGVRDRAITDTFEPGSTVKVITLAQALISGKYTPTTPINTNPGYYYIGRHRVRDDGNYGLIDVTGVLTKSSNVGVSKIALSLDRQSVYNQFIKSGVGSNPGGAFPAEASGVIHPFSRIGKFVFATMTFGYAISMSTLQLARLYAAIADNGVIRLVSFLKTSHPDSGVRIMPVKVAHQLRNMLATVVGMHGTGILANIPGYKVAGKTGTAHLVGPHGFYHNRFNAVFVGMVPLKDPRLVIAVRINDPKGHYNGFGGVSAAPVFADIALAGMHLLNVPPTEDHINQKLFRNQKRFIRLITQA